MSIRVTIGSGLLWLAVPVAVVQGADARCDPAASGRAIAPVARTDQQSSGNRISDGCGLAGSGFVDVRLGAAPVWVLPDPADRGSGWLVSLEDGSVLRVHARADGDVSVDPGPLMTLGPGEPPVARVRADGALAIEAAADAVSVFADAVPDARVVESAEGTQVALSGPTERYPHGVLGDAIEASSLSLRHPDGSVDRLEFGPTLVIEGLAPILADLDADGHEEIIVTASDASEGARLAIVGLDGMSIATGEPIGQGFRWLHQIGAGPAGPGGETEVIVVRTPHIGGIVEAWRLVDGQLTRVAREAGYSSHQNGSTNLDMALLADADGDGRLDVIVPTQDMATLGVLTREGQGFRLLGSLPLGGELVTNVAATPDSTGRLNLAAGTRDGRLRIFR